VDGNRSTPENMEHRFLQLSLLSACNLNVLHSRRNIQSSLYVFCRFTRFPGWLLHFLYWI